MERPSDCAVFVNNGSRYQLEICDLQTEVGSLSVHSDVDNRHFADVTASANPRTSVQSIVIGVGEEIKVPVSFKYISIFLRDAKNTQVLENWAVAKNMPTSGDMSIIVTEESSVQFGYADKSVADWKWVSSSGDKLDEHSNHRPRKSFVANASGRKITVSGKAEGGESFTIPVKSGETATIKCENIIISWGDMKFRVKTKPRTSVVVLSDNYKVTGQLHGENIEEEKWKVDGKNYKPISKLEWFKSNLSAFNSFLWTIISTLKIWEVVFQWTKNIFFRG